MRRAQPLDAAFLGLEAPGHPLHTMAVMVLDPATVPGGYSFRKLRSFISGRLVAIPPLRRRLVPAPLGLARPGWVDARVDIRAHVFRHVRTGGTMADVARFAATIATVPLDRQRPLWEMHVIEGLGSGQIAVVAKVHHALMDGVAGMDFLASMFSLRPQASPVQPVAADATTGPGPLAALAPALGDLGTLPVRATQAFVTSTLAARRVFRSARRHGPITVPHAPRIPWNDALGDERVLAFASLPLGEVKAVSHTAGCTVNDVVLSVIGGACRSFLEERKSLPASSLVAAVPVSTHEAGTGPKVANNLSLTVAPLGTDIEDPWERLALVHDRMIRAKRLQDAIGSALLPRLLAVPNPLLLSSAARAYLGLRLAIHTRVANVLVSNVAGPPVPLYFGGARLDALYPLGPVYDGVGLNVTVISCMETMSFGFVSSPAVIGDLDALAGRIPHEFAALVRAGHGRTGIEAVHDVEVPLVG